jgi:hypothetical protein
LATVTGITIQRNTVRVAKVVRLAHSLPMGILLMRAMAMVVPVIVVALPLDSPGAAVSEPQVHCAPSKASKAVCAATDDIEIKSAPNSKDLPGPASGAIGKVAPVVHPVKMWS